MGGLAWRISAIAIDDTEATSASPVSELLMTSTASFSSGASTKREWKASVAPLCRRSEASPSGSSQGARQP